MHRRRRDKCAAPGFRVLFLFGFFYYRRAREKPHTSIVFRKHCTSYNGYRCARARVFYYYVSNLFPFASHYTIVQYRYAWGVWCTVIIYYLKRERRGAYPVRSDERGSNQGSSLGGPCRATGSYNLPSYNFNKKNDFCLNSQFYFERIIKTSPKIQKCINNSIYNSL